jgi:hypothetical protein
VTCSHCNRRLRLTAAVAGNGPCPAHLPGQSQISPCSCAFQVGLYFSGNGSCPVLWGYHGAKQHVRHSALPASPPCDEAMGHARLLGHGAPPAPPAPPDDPPPSILTACSASVTMCHAPCGDPPPPRAAVTTCSTCAPAHPSGPLLLMVTTSSSCCGDDVLCSCSCSSRWPLAPRGDPPPPHAVTMMSSARAPAQPGAPLLLAVTRLLLMLR